MTLTSDSPASITASRALSLALGQGGGPIQGLSVSAIDKPISHGSLVRISAEPSYTIGGKDTPAPKLWAMGGEVYIDGVQAQAEAIGGAIDTTNIWSGGVTDVSLLVVDNDDLRHGRVDRFYRFRGKAEIAYPKSFESITKAQSEKLAYFARYNAGSQYQGNRIFDCENVAGSFIFPDTRARGEVCDITTADGLATYQCYVTFVDAAQTYVTVEPIGFAWGSGAPGTSEFFGGTLTGTVSGATLDISVANATRDTSSVKFFRFDQNGGRTNEVYLTYSDNSNGQFFDGAELSGVEQNSPYIFSGLGSPADNPGNWQMVGIVADYSGTSSKKHLRLNNSWIFSNETNDVEGFNAAVEPLRPSIFGMETNGIGIPASSIGIGMALGEIYMDNDDRVLWLCDAATFASSNDPEPQRPDVWTENADGSVVIDAYINQGAYSTLTGKYLAMTKGNAVLFEGLAI